MTLHARQLQSLAVFFAANLDVDPIVVSEDGITPLVQQFHMIISHLTDRGDTLLLAYREVRFRYGACIQAVIPERKGHEDDEDHQSRYDCSFIVHVRLL